jgi:CheY-like chemotaxis protein
MKTSFKDTTVLIVEDNPDHIGLIEAVVSRGLRGARIRVALLCEGARSYLRGEWPEYEDDTPNNPIPDVIVMDLWLPDGSGFELLRWISERETLKDIPVVVFTASTDAEDAKLAKDLGVRRYLQKPAQFGRLVKAIKEELTADDARKGASSMNGSAPSQEPARQELV